MIIYSVAPVGIIDNVILGQLTSFLPRVCRFPLAISTVKLQISAVWFPDICIFIISYRSSIYVQFGYDFRMSCVFTQYIPESSLDLVNSTFRLLMRYWASGLYTVLSLSSNVVSGSPAASPDSSDNSDTQHSGGSDMEMDDQMMTGSKRNQQRLSDTEV